MLFKKRTKFRLRISERVTWRWHINCFQGQQSFKYENDFISCNWGKLLSPFSAFVLIFNNSIYLYTERPRIMRTMMCYYFLTLVFLWESPVSCPICIRLLQLIHSTDVKDLLYCVNLKTVIIFSILKLGYQNRVIFFLSVVMGNHLRKVQWNSLFMYKVFRKELFKA